MCEQSLINTTFFSRQVGGGNASEQALTRAGGVSPEGSDDSDPLDAPPHPFRMRQILLLRWEKNGRRKGVVLCNSWSGSIGLHMG